ncbi:MULTISPECIES: hypothetical protein [Streptomycetaceae]|uniref:hypothetical protein n=1 Tax=Streptomycetaceae TaxID=2062 RepID=UPI001160F093|nr:hypothetical protein [Streptomyces sp. CB02056]
MSDRKGAPALTALVLAALDRPGMSLRRLAEASVDPETGDRISQTWLHDIAHDQVRRAPEPKFLRALAAGTGKPLVRVQQAAASQFLGYTATELSDLPEDARVIVGHLAGMDASELPQVRAVIEALLAKTDESSGKRDV